MNKSTLSTFKKSGAKKHKIIENSGSNISQTYRKHLAKFCSTFHYFVKKVDKVELNDLNNNQ